jgi:hypothetical protein
MKRQLIWSIAGCLAALSAAAETPYCADLADPEERLTCYDHLAECVTTHSADDRLACYDSAQVPRSSTARTETPAAEPAPPPARTADEAFPLPNEAREAQEESSALVARIVKVEQGPRGYHYLTLDNGQVWRELTDGRMRFEPGDQVELSKGILGSVNLRLEDRTGYIKVRRVQ